MTTSGFFAAPGGPASMRLPGDRQPVVSGRTLWNLNGWNEKETGGITLNNRPGGPGHGVHFKLPTKFEKKILWTNGPVTVKIPTTKYKTGPSWERFRDEAWVKYYENPNSPDYNRDKFFLLDNTGLLSGVTYEN